MLQYPPPKCPWDAVSIDLLQLSESFRLTIPPGVCGSFFKINRSSTVKNKTAASVAHALVNQLICSNTTTRIQLSENGEELKNTILLEICNRYITQTSTVAYHPTSNGFVEQASRKISNALHPVVNPLFENWEGWNPQISAYLNNVVSE